MLTRLRLRLMMWLDAEAEWERAPRHVRRKLWLQWLRKRRVQHAAEIAS